MIITRNHLPALSAPLALLTVVATAVLAGCGSSGGDENKLVIYNGREVELVKPLFDKFEQDTGIKLEVRNAESPELAATLLEEGKNSPADVFYAQDAGAIGSLAAEGLLAPLPTSVAGKVDDPRFKDRDGRWTGITGRVRVLAYNTDRVKQSELPDTVLALTDPKWKGRVGIAPGNASFEAFVTAMRIELGDEKTKAWLQALKDNDVRTFEKNSQIVEAVSRGEIDAGLVNHYYLYLVREELGEDAPIANKYLPGDDPGALVSVAGAGVLSGSEHESEARSFVEFLLSDASQRFYVDEAEEAEIPLVDGIDPKPGVPRLDELEKRGPRVDLSSFGGELEKTLELLDETGFTS